MTLLIDTNPQVGAKKHDIGKVKLDELIPIDDMKACPRCLTDEYLTDLDESHNEFVTEQLNKS